MLTILFMFACQCRVVESEKDTDDHHTIIIDLTDSGVLDTGG